MKSSGLASSELLLGLLCWHAVLCVTFLLEGAVRLARLHIPITRPSSGTDVHAFRFRRVERRHPARRPPCASPEGSCGLLPEGCSWAALFPTRAGPAVCISFAFAAVSSIFSALGYAELAARIPESGFGPC